MRTKVTKEFIEEVLKEGKSLRQTSIEMGKNQSWLSSHAKKFGIEYDNGVNLINQKFERLLVTRRVENRIMSGKTARYWLCQCDCGNSLEVKASSLMGGYTKSCGCYKIDKNNKNSFGELPLSRYNQCKTHAKRRGWDFDISMEDIWNVYVEQNRKCKLSGLDVVFRRRYEKRNVGKFIASIDRIDPTIGYFRDNIQILFKDINMIKRSMEEDDFVYYCKLISNFDKNKIFLPNEDIKNYINKEYWGRMKNRAEVSNFEFNLNIEDVWKIYLKQNGRCALSGLPIRFRLKRSDKNQTASLDRIDNNIGYNLENCQFLHKDINMIKWKLDQNYFIHLCDLITENKNGNYSMVI